MGTKRRRRSQSRRFVVILCILVLWVGFNFARNAYRNYRLRLEIESLRREIAAIELRNKQLEDEIENWQSPEYVERVAREELGLVKPGERVYVIAQPKNGDR